MENSSVKIVQTLVDLAVMQTEKMMEGKAADSEYTVGLTKYRNDIQLLLAAAIKVHEPETKRFLLVLTATFASTNPIMLLVAKKVLKDAITSMMHLVTEINAKDCDEDCDKCEIGSLANTECVGKA